MIRAVSAALEDDDSLVRRGALDILLQSLPVNSAAVQKAPQDDRSILMQAATSVVLRRDLALNRRLYTWLLGPEETSHQQVAYLKANSLGLLTTTLKASATNGYKQDHIDIIGLGRDVSPVVRVFAVSAIQNIHFLTRQVGNWVAADRSTCVRRIQGTEGEHRIRVRSWGRGKRRITCTLSAGSHVLLLDDYDGKHPIRSCRASSTLEGALKLRLR